MKLYFVYRNVDDKVLKFFERNGFSATKLESIGNKVKDAGIVYNFDCMDIDVNKSNTNILLLSTSIINTSNITKYDFYLPTSPLLFFNMMITLKHKLLLPVNIFDESHWGNYYCTDKFYRGYRSMLSSYGKGSQKSCGVVIYGDTNELVGKDYSNVKIMNIDKVVRKTIANVSNYLDIGKRFSNFKKFRIPSSISYETVSVKSYDEELELKRGVRYFITRKGFNFYRCTNFSEIVDNYTKCSVNCVTFPIAGLTDNEFGVMWLSNRNKTISMCDMLDHVDFHDTRTIGQNNKKISDEDVNRIYEAYGKHTMYHMYEHLIKVQNSYYDILAKFIRKINIISDQKCNSKKFMRILAFWGGLNGYTFNVKDVSKFIKNNKELFQQKNVLLLSKSIVTYGGNQKTAVQLYNELVEEGYNVKLGCVTNSDLVNCIDKNDILKFDDVADIIKEANSGNYECVVANKLNQFIGIAKEIKPRCMFITHNSMDPINRELIANHEHFDKIFTINNYHISLLFDNNVRGTVTRYLNYDDNPRSKINNRKGYVQNITFIGRLSNEKNIDLLLEAFKIFRKDHKKIKLTVIGDGNVEFKQSNYPNVNFVGRSDYETIVYYLANSDYLISTSCTEGLPFTFLEAMSIGIPVISSNILGCNEVIKEEDTGFLFDFEEYNENKNSMDCKDGIWNVFDVIAKHKEQNLKNIIKCLNRAYNVDIKEWNEMSNNCHKYYEDHFNANKLFKQNMNNLEECNKVVIVCPDCDPLFEKLFKNVDIVEKLDKSKEELYDIVVRVDTFDVFCGRLSLLRSHGFAERNLIAMDKTLSRLYKANHEGTISDVKVCI